MSEQPDCEWLNCLEPATAKVYQRQTKKILFVCSEHAEIVIDQDNPEYWTECPNCKCQFGVN